MTGYPVELQAGDETGPVVVEGELTFTDDDNQPGTVATVTSDDGSLTVTDPHGPSVDLAVADSPSIDGVTVTGTPSAGQTIVATAADAAHWATPAGGGGAVAYYRSLINSGAPSAGGIPWVLSVVGTIPIDPLGIAFGNFVAYSVAPLTTYAAMATVLDFNEVVITATDTTGDNYDTSVTILIQDQTGAQSLTLAGFKIIAPSPTGGTATYAISDLTPTANTGSDLTQDGETVVTTAGGDFSVVVRVEGDWD